MYNDETKLAKMQIDRILMPNNCYNNEKQFQGTAVSIVQNQHQSPPLSLFFVGQTHTTATPAHSDMHDL